MNHIKTGESSNRFWLIQIAILIIAVMGFIIWEKYYAPTLKEEIFEAAMPIAFHGKIDSVYRDRSNHDVEKVMLSDGIVYEIYRPWESMVELGDSLSKAKGSLQVKVYKKDGRRIILDYRQLLKGFNKGWWQR